MRVEAKLAEMGITLPDYSKEGYPGADLRHHEVPPPGRECAVPQRPHSLEGRRAGRYRTLGKDVTIEQGYEAARLTAIHCFAGIKHAVGDLDKIVAIVRSLNFVVCTPDFTDVNRVSSGATDLFVEVLGEARGLGGRATIGVTSLSSGVCFENWLTVEIQDEFIPDEVGQE